jgi:hypothetical protein
MEGTGRDIEIQAADGMVGVEGKEELGGDKWFHKPYP